MGIALARLVLGSRKQEPLVDDGAQSDLEPLAAEQVPFTAVPDPEPIMEPVIGWDGVSSSVRVEITNDGSVVVVGSHNAVPREQGEIIACVATGAALKALEPHPRLQALPRLRRPRAVHQGGQGSSPEPRPHPSGLTFQLAPAPRPSRCRGHRRLSSSTGL